MEFRFRLQTVYDLKQHMEDEQKDALARERIKLDNLAAEEQSLKQKLMFWSKRYLSSASEGISPIEVVQIGRYIEELNQNIIKTGRQIERQKAVVERERQLLIEKMKERKTLETLHDKQLERFKYEQGKEQEKEIEELISSRK